MVPDMSVTASESDLAFLERDFWLLEAASVSLVSSASPDLSASVAKRNSPAGSDPSAAELLSCS